jgi:FlaA1/EpsC-like NDP-sugar epimerase
MASIIPIGRAHALRDRSRPGPLEPSVIDPRDLVGAVDDHTRELLARAPAARRNRMLPAALVVADVIALALAFVLASLVRQANGLFASTQALAVFLLALPCWILVATLLGMYRRDHERVHHRTSDEIVGIFQVVTIGAWLLLLACRMERWHAPGVLTLALSSALAICIVPVAREVARRGSKRATAYAQNTVIVGAGDIGQLICRRLNEHPEHGANVVGFVDRNPKIRDPDLPEHMMILGDVDRLPEIVAQLQVERVVVAFSNESVSDLLPILGQLRTQGIQIDVVPWLFELIGPDAFLDSVEGLPLIGLHSKNGVATSNT